MKPYDIVAEYLDKNKNMPYNKYLKFIIETYQLSPAWATKAYTLATRYAGQGGIYEILLLFDTIVSLTKEYEDASRI